ncbi:MAG: DUF370 domain-containing protein [Ruminococcus sp.]|nr:DUF370 domain-containing protein [Oscillospiraceae bacterium]MBR2723968.1 DUF370 domain-containing protein [Ruminococcus sp.]
MYLHLGQDTVVPAESIVGIYDMDTSTVSKWSREYLNRAEKEGRVINVSFYDLPKSFIICKEIENEKEIERVYISPLSSQTLQRRSQSSQLIK